VTPGFGYATAMRGKVSDLPTPEAPKNSRGV